MFSRAHSLYMTGQTLNKLARIWVVANSARPCEFKSFVVDRMKMVTQRWQPAMFSPCPNKWHVKSSMDSGGLYTKQTHRAAARHVILLNYAKPPTRDDPSLASLEAYSGRPLRLLPDSAGRRRSRTSEARRNLALAKHVVPKANQLPSCFHRAGVKVSCCHKLHWAQVRWHITLR